MKKNIVLYIIGLASLTLTACTDFLNVHPKSSISEDELFTSEVGFQQSLTGIYSQMAQRKLYGDNLSMGFVSALGQNYNPVANGFVFKESTALNYDSQEVKDRIESIWTASYTTIAGLNNILDKIDAQKGVFSGVGYATTKAEALGLRAYLHFELLRLFGAIPALAADSKALPYRKDLNSLSQKPETVQEMISYALADLEQAEALLQGIDPILGGDKDRRFRMNIWAIKGLQARVYLYNGNTEAAKIAAEAVINSQNFKFVTNAEISTSSAGKDRLFSNEQVFSLRVFEMKEWVETGTSAYFRYTTSLSQNNLTRTEPNFATLYETAGGGSTDYRYVYLLENDGTTKFPSKFWQTSTAVGKNKLDQTVPLIRLSEMYYILAETSADPAIAAGYLNKVRENRGLGALNTAGMTTLTIANEITKEYQKEFYAEGQLFFYYKRLNFARMLFSGKNMNSKLYILPLPDSETEFNPQYN